VPAEASKLAVGVAATSWQRGVVRAINRLTPELVALRIEVPDRIAHLPGQHFVVRLTADDGYTASRSYSIASAPGDDLLELCVERLPDGEVSGYLYDVLEVGDELEVRGPIGGWFVWDGVTPAAGIGGGSGVVPFISMLRHAHDVKSADRLKLAFSARTMEQLPYADELISSGATVVTTGGPGGHRLGRAEVMPLLAGAQTAFICGSARFAEAMSRLTVELEVPAAQVRVERFGPTG
jgi:ferredoxin-NADP reductase